MKVVINAENIEMHPETPHERQALERLRAARDVRVGLVDPWGDMNDLRTVFLIPKDDWGT